MANNIFLVVTSIAKQDNPVLMRLAKDSAAHEVPFIVVGDTKSPRQFDLEGCEFYSVERQKSLSFELAKVLPFKHYARKNLGYLIAMSKGAEIIIETDDDNFPIKGFWNDRTRQISARVPADGGWINVYKYFTKIHIWPRGFALENIMDRVPPLADKRSVDCPIQQGLADENPDVDAIYRLTMPLPVTFDRAENVALGKNSFCPFNSQNTTWFREAFPLMYLPYYCSFRMTDIWRSFVAQRVAWTCGWNILFHQSTVRQERNDHNLMDDFRDEIIGYNNNNKIFNSLKELNLKGGVENISSNMIRCYEKLIELGLVGAEELHLLKAWLQDIADIKN